MDGSAERASELTAYYLDGEISEDELVELESLIRDHKAARIAFLDGAHLHSALTSTVAPTLEAEMASQARLRAMKRPRISRRSSPAPRRRGRIIWTVGTLAAASLVLVAGLRYIVWPRDGARDAVVAKITSLTGDVTVRRGDSEFSASEGIDILEGDSVVASDGGTARVEFIPSAPASGESPPAGGVRLTTHGDSKINVEYAAEETMIALTGDTAVKLWMENGAKRVALEAGRLECEFDVQPVDKAMVFNLPNAEAIEVDSRRLKVMASADLTEVEIEGGSVRLSKPGRDWPLWLGPGYHAIRGRTTDPGRGGPRARQGETWPPPAGKILMKDDFAGGVSNWRLLEISDGDGRAPGRTVLGGRGFQVTESTSGGRRLKTLEIDARGSTLGVELREPLGVGGAGGAGGAKAFVIDYEWRIDSLREGAASAPLRLDALFGGGEAIKLPGAGITVKPGVWIRQRVQIGPVKASGGEFDVVATEWVDGLRGRSFRFSRRDEGGIRLVYEGASVRLRNILIREP